MEDNFDELYGDFTDDALDQIDLLSQAPSSLGMRGQSADFESLLQITSQHQLRQVIEGFSSDEAKEMLMLSIDETQRLKKHHRSQAGSTTALQNRVNELNSQITNIKRDKVELNMQLKKAQQRRSVEASLPFKEKEFHDLKRKLAELQDSQFRNAAAAAHSSAASLTASRACSDQGSKQGSELSSIHPPTASQLHTKRLKRPKPETAVPNYKDQSSQTDDKPLEIKQHSLLRALFHDEAAIHGIFALMQPHNDNLHQHRFALFGCLCQEISGHRVSAAAFLSLLGPFANNDQESVAMQFHHVLVVLRVLIYSSDVFLHNILGLDPGSSLHKEDHHSTLSALVAAVPRSLGVQQNSEASCRSARQQSSIQSLMRILHTLAAECPAKSRSVFGGLLDGALDLLIANTAMPVMTTFLSTESTEYEMIQLGIEIVGHLLQCPELAMKVWKSDQPLPRRIIHVAQKVPQLRAAAVQLVCMVVSQEGGMDALLGLRDGGHLEYKSLVPTFVYWLYSEASKEENIIGVSLVQRLIAILGGMKKRIQVKPLLHSVIHILIWSIKRLKLVQYKLTPNLSEYEIRQLQDLY